MQTPRWVSAGRASERQAIRRVREFIHRNCTRRLPVAELARLAGLSRYHFIRVFGEEVGMTPYQYALAARVREAAHMLDEGWSISQAAYRTGFADQSHLTRQFKRQLGVTPGRQQAIRGS